MTHIDRATAPAARMLTERLGQLGEADCMKPALQQAVERLTAERVEVERYEIDHCKVTPWQDISIAVSLSVRSTKTGERSHRVVSGTILPDLGEARDRLRREVPDAVAAGGPGAPAALIADMAMIVRLFPDDSGLSGLRGATDSAAMYALLTTHLPECRDQGWTIRALEYQPVQYKPGRLCTLRYTVTLDHPRLGSKDVEVFGKVYRDERWRRAYDLLDATSQAAAASGGVWRAARPIAVVPEWRFVAQSAVAGRQFRHALGDLTRPDAQPDELREADRHVAAVARAIRAFQQSSIVSGPCLDFGFLFAAQRDNLEHLRQINPALAAELQALRAAIGRVAGESPASGLGPAHGDFAHGNVLVQTIPPVPSIGIIDFDRAGQAEPAYDVAYFLTHLSSFAMRHPERAAQVRELSDRLRGVYCGLAPGVPARRLALYEALDLSAYVLRNFRKRSHQPEWIGWATGQIAAAWERLDHASPDARAAS
jgi:hypothetical protein